MSDDLFHPSRKSNSSASPRQDQDAPADIKSPHAPKEATTVPRVQQAGPAYVRVDQTSAVAIPRVKPGKANPAPTRKPRVPDN